MKLLLQMTTRVLLEFCSWRKTTPLDTWSCRTHRQWKTTPLDTWSCRTHRQCTWLCPAQIHLTLLHSCQFRCVGHHVSPCIKAKLLEPQLLTASPSCNTAFCQPHPAPSNPDVDAHKLTTHLPDMARICRVPRAWDQPRVRLGQEGQGMCRSTMRQLAVAVFELREDDIRCHCSRRMHAPRRLRRWLSYPWRCSGRGTPW